MLRIYTLLSLFFIVGTTHLQSQHFDDLYNIDTKLTGPTKWLRDSLFGFDPTLVRLRLDNIFSANPGEGVLVRGTIESTDNSGLTFVGRVNFYIRPIDLPAGIDLGIGDVLLSTMLIPRDLLFFGDDESEQNMGLDDPYLPLSTVGRLERYGETWIAPPIIIPVQLNELVVN